VVFTFAKMIANSIVAFALLCLLPWLPTNQATKEYTITVPERSRLSALHRAVISDDVGRVKKLLKQFLIDRNPRAPHGETPLHWAVRMGRRSLVEALLNGRVYSNAVDDDGNTPLHDAAAYGKRQDIDVVRLLLSRGADPNIRNKRNKTALRMAIDNPSSEFAIIELMLNAGAIVEDADIYAAGSDILKQTLREARENSRSALEYINDSF
jgi:ankyrin repeat protein